MCTQFIGVWAAWTLFPLIFYIMSILFNSSGTILIGHFQSCYLPQTHKFLQPTHFTYNSLIPLARAHTREAHANIHTNMCSICTVKKQATHTIMVCVAYIVDSYMHMTHMTAHTHWHTHTHTRCSTQKKQNKKESHRFQRLLQRWWRDEGGGGGRIIDPSSSLSPLLRWRYCHHHLSQKKKKKKKKCCWCSEVSLSSSSSSPDYDHFNPSFCSRSPSSRIPLLASLLLLLQAGSSPLLAAESIFF